MSSVERRRAPRFHVFQEEAAVIHASNRDIPVKLVDLSCTGALMSMDMFAPVARVVDADERLQLSMHDDGSVFDVAARVVRTSQHFVAVEFLNEGDGVRRVGEKLKVLQARQLT